MGPGILPEAIVGNTSISDGIEVHKCIWYGQLACLKGNINAERYIKILEQHMLPFIRHLFQGRPCVCQQDNANSTGFVVEESGC